MSHTTAPPRLKRTRARRCHRTAAQGCSQTCPDHTGSRSSCRRCCLSGTGQQHRRRIRHQPTCYTWTIPFCRSRRSSTSHTSELLWCHPLDTDPMSKPCKRCPRKWCTMTRPSFRSHRSSTPGMCWLQPRQTCQRRSLRRAWLDHYPCPPYQPRIGRTPTRQPAHKIRRRRLCTASTGRRPRPLCRLSRGLVLSRAPVALVAVWPSDLAGLSPPVSGMCRDHCGISLSP